MFITESFKGKNSWIRYVFGFIIILIGYAIGSAPVMLEIMKPKSDPDTDLSAYNEAIGKGDLSILGLDSNYLMILILVSFVGIFIALWVAVKFIHSKSFKSVITSAANVRWSRIFFGFGLWMLFGLLFELIMYFIHPDNYTFQANWSRFTYLLLISIFILPIQTSAEEIWFRGYWLQGMSHWAPARWIPILLTSILFGLMHGMNPEVAEYGLGIMMPYYIGVGLFLAIITVMDDGLELALGIHAATNMFGSLFVTFDASALQTDAIFRINDMNVGLYNIAFLVMSALFFLICSKKYNWHNWEKLYGPIHAPIINTENVDNEFL